MKKKSLMLIIVLLLCVCFVPEVLATDITGCNGVLSGIKIDVRIANTTHTIITVIKIVVPVLLVIFGMLDLFKGITAQKEDEIKKGQQIFIKRLISGAIIFFVVSIVQLLISFAAGDEGENLLDCASCFLNGANETTGDCK